MTALSVATFNLGAELFKGRGIGEKLSRSLCDGGVTGSLVFVFI